MNQCGYCNRITITCPSHGLCELCEDQLQLTFLNCFNCYAKATLRSLVGAARALERVAEDEDIPVSEDMAQDDPFVSKIYSVETTDDLADNGIGRKKP